MINSVDQAWEYRLTIYRYANIVWFSKYHWNIVIAFFYHITRYLIMKYWSILPFFFSRQTLQFIRINILEDLCKLAGKKRSQSHALIGPCLDCRLTRCVDLGFSVFSPSNPTSPLFCVPSPWDVSASSSPSGLATSPNLAVWPGADIQFGSS